MPVQVSVVVCTYNRADLLKEALLSLAQQTADASVYEIVVIDNNSTDHTQEVVSGFMAQHANCRLCIEPRQGLSCSRNRGFQTARADWVAYMDDDARARPDFVERILYVIGHFPFDGFGGVYLPWYKYGKPKWFRDEYATNGRLLDTTGVLTTGEICGGVCAFKKSVLSQCDGFMSSLGMNGNKMAYGEETQLQIRMRKKGFVIGFDPFLIIEHVVAPYKLSLLWFFRAAYSHGSAHWDAYEKPPEWRSIVHLFFGLISFTCKNSVRCTLRLLLHEYYIQNWIIDLAWPSALNMGMIVSGIKKLTSKPENSSA